MPCPPFDAQQQRWRFLVSERRVTGVQMFPSLIRRDAEREAPASMPVSETFETLSRPFILCC